jgi:hypothetical protein
MAVCTFCKAETERYDSGVPVCVKCSEMTAANANRTSEHQVLNVLNQDHREATERSKAATAAFDAATSDILAGYPIPMTHNEFTMHRVR